MPGSMQRALATVLFFLVLWPAAAAAQAPANAPAAMETLVLLQRIGMDVALMEYDEANPEYRASVRGSMQAIEAPMAAVLAELAKAGAEAAEAPALWKTAREAVLGGPGVGKGLLVTGYDAKVNSDFISSARALAEMIEKAWAFDQTATPEQRAWLLASKIVSNYTQVAAAAFGSYTYSANDDESDFPALVARLDKLLAQLAKQHAGNADEALRLRKLTSKWQFIKPTILKVGNQSTPFIVYKHGLDIVAALKPR